MFLARTKTIKRAAVAERGRDWICFLSLQRFGFKKVNEPQGHQGETGLL